MATRASVYNALLKRFRSKEDDFLSPLVTVDETWVHYYEPENKAQSRQSVGPGYPEAKEVQNATFCWQGDGNCILGCTRRYYVGLSSKEKYNNRCVLCKFARLTENCDPRKMLRQSLQRDSAPTGLCESPHLQNCNGCC